MTKRFFSILTIGLISIISYAQSCDEVTDKLLNKLSNTSFYSDFNISITEPETQALNYSGQITTKGKSFNLQMMGVQAFYDGNTLSVYDRDLDEINISKPTDEELTESNPLLLIQLIRHTCWLRFTDNFGDKTIWSVDFYPKEKMSDVLKYTVRFRRNDLVPTCIISEEKHNRQTKIILSGQKYGVTTEGKFTLDKNKYPTATINEL